ncbi:hypothetical protein Ahy_B06g084273 [Arachis hypogaea]|uniref:Uncharacterized protein n=1 Tax=Arachis hypogaea TaxID=3818 RepID=A0A444YRH8_ARAHY|nr:hypothetical protein Ahy_B06g084273 [Arachis hypogaea]
MPLSPLHSRASVSHHQRRQPPPSSRTSTASSNNPSSEADPNSYGGDTVTGQNRKFCLPPLTPRSQQSSKSRSSLPPLQPLLIARRSLDEWPQASSDDIGEWLPPQLPLSPGDGMRGNPGERLKLDLSSIQMNNDRNCNNGSNSGNNNSCNNNGVSGLLYDVFDYFEDVSEQNGRVFVHCCQGESRSTSLRKVDCYDVDYEVFQKTIVGGFVPPFPSSENEHETHLPARESSWSALRRKVSSSHMKEIVTAPKSSLPRVYSDSMLCIHSTKTSSPSSSSSPSYISPDSVSSSSYISPWKEGEKRERLMGVKYNSFVIDSDEGLQVLFHYRRQFPEVRILELLAKLVDVISNSGGLNQNHQSITMATASSLTPVVASSSLPVMASAGGANMNTPVMILIYGEVGKQDVVEDVLGDDDDVEPAMIDDDNDDDIGRSIPVGAGAPSILGTQQYPSHFSTLDLDAMKQ